jgi:chromosome segregation ATPase
LEAEKSKLKEENLDLGVRLERLDEKLKTKYREVCELRQKNEFSHQQTLIEQLTLQLNSEKSQSRELSKTIKDLDDKNSTLKKMLTYEEASLSSLKKKFAEIQKKYTNLQLSCRTPGSEIDLMKSYGSSQSLKEQLRESLQQNLNNKTYRTTKGEFAGNFLNQNLGTGTDLNCKIFWNRLLLFYQE